jgi:hypothetical protein
VQPAISLLLLLPLLAQPLVYPRHPFARPFVPHHFLVLATLNLYNAAPACYLATHSRLLAAGTAPPPDTYVPALLAVAYRAATAPFPLPLRPAWQHHTLLSCSTAPTFSLCHFIPTRRCSTTLTADSILHGAPDTAHGRRTSARHFTSLTAACYLTYSQHLAAGCLLLYAVRLLLRGTILTGPVAVPYPLFHHPRHYPVNV